MQPATHAADPCPHQARPALCELCDARPLSICSGVPDAAIRELEKAVTDVKAPPRTPIVDEGEPARHVFNVTGGTVKVYKTLPDGRRQVVGFLTQGDFLGFAIRDVYAYSAEAVDEVRLCRFPRKALEDLLERFPDMEKRLLGLAGNELAAAQDLMLLLGRKTAKERLATFLLSLSDRARRIGRPGSPIALPMSRADIADHLGLTTETVSRAMTQMRSQGLIRLDGPHQATLVDLDGLRALTEGEGA